MIPLSLLLLLATLKNDDDKDNDGDNNYTWYGDYFIEDIELKKLYPDRYNFYEKLIEAYNKNPKELYKTFGKYYRFKELLNDEKKFFKEYIFYNDKLNIVNDNIENRELYLNEIQLLKDFNKPDTPEPITEIKTPMSIFLIVAVVGAGVFIVLFWDDDWCIVPSILPSA